MPRPAPFEAVLFDLDGTLVATERFWVAAARSGARRAFAELGVERELPDAAAWMGMVGLPLERAFDAVFADLAPAQRAHVLARCVEAEEAALRAGEAALLPGAWEALSELRERGARLGIASNCGRGYLESMLRDLRLGELVDETRCLDSPGVQCKADMLGDLLATFGTRSAVMVGDRRGDAEAAHAHGLPHVHLCGGFAPRGEEVEAEARLQDLGELVPCLDGRWRWIEAELEALGAWSAPILLVGGGPAAGKSLFARDVARLARARGRPAEVLTVDTAAELEGLAEQVLEPHAGGRGVPQGRLPADLPPEGLLVVEGRLVGEPGVRAYGARVLELAVPERVALARVAGRAKPGLAADELVRARREELPAWRARKPALRPDRVLDGELLWGPADSRWARP